METGVSGEMLGTAPYRVVEAFREWSETATTLLLSVAGEFALEHMTWALSAILILAQVSFYITDRSCMVNHNVMKTP